MMNISIKQLIITLLIITGVAVAITGACAPKIPEDGSGGTVTGAVEGGSSGTVTGAAEGGGGETVTGAAVGVGGEAISGATEGGGGEAMSDAADLRGTVYYVAPDGSDANDGLSPGAPWRSLARASRARLGADGGAGAGGGAGGRASGRLLFKAGGVWSGGQLRVTGAKGAEGDPVIIGKYGDGPDPVIDGGGLERGGTPENAAVLIRNCEYITVRNLDVMNNSGDSFTESKSNPKNPYLTGIYIENNNAGDLRDITIMDNTIHNVASRMGGSGGGPKATGGIVAAVSGNAAQSKFTNLRITGNEIYDVCHEGIYLESSWSARRMVAGESWGVPEKWYGWDGVYIAHNYIHHTAGDGITIINTNDALVEFNLLDGVSHSDYDNSGNPAHAGLWMWNANNVHIRYNEVMNTGGARIRGVDDMAFDFDYGSQNCLYEYNYSHGNMGGFLMICPNHWSGRTGGGITINHVARYNISVNDKYRPLRLTGAIADMQKDEVHIYNNTICWTDSVTAPVVDLQPGGQTYQIYNNIFFGPKSGAPWPSNPRTAYANNLVFGGAQQGYPASAAGTAAADPLFAGEFAAPDGYFDRVSRTVTLGDVSGFMLQSGSPAAGAGMEFLPAPDKHNESAIYSTAAQKVPQWIMPPEADYFGNPITGAPSIGAHHVAD